MTTLLQPSPRSRPLPRHPRRPGASRCATRFRRQPQRPEVSACLRKAIRGQIKDRCPGNRSSCKDRRSPPPPQRASSTAMKLRYACRGPATQARARSETTRKGAAKAAKTPPPKINRTPSRSASRRQSGRGSRALQAADRRRRCQRRSRAAGPLSADGDTQRHDHLQHDHGIDHTARCASRRPLPASPATRVLSTALFYSADGASIITASKDATVKVWRQSPPA